MHERAFATRSSQEPGMPCQLPSACRQQVDGRAPGVSIHTSTLGTARPPTHHPTALPWQPGWELAGGGGANLLRSQCCVVFSSGLELGEFWQCWRGRLWCQQGMGPELFRAAPARGKHCK